MHERGAHQAVEQQLEEFVVFSRDGEVWRALRQPLGGGIYRTPDDPTARDLVHEQLGGS